ncbi:HNH endonuclease, partial [Bacillus cereus]|uniref:HNH endonuclease n=1 Tax=Bacillus cereus TaxID=1396 RepID=UPI0018F53FAB
VEIDHMYGGTGSKHGNKARRSNFAQANEKLAEQLNKSPELASKFGMKPGNITKSDIEGFRPANNSTWHELNDVKTMQL